MCYSPLNLILAIWFNIIPDGVAGGACGGASIGGACGAGGCACGMLGYCGGFSRLCSPNGETGSAWSWVSFKFFCSMISEMFFEMLNREVEKCKIEKLSKATDQCI